jgi:hypothetical protein
MSALSSQSYTIGNLAKVWAIAGSTVITQIPACEYSCTLTSSTTSTIVTAPPDSTILFSVYSRNVVNAGSFPISVTATLDSSNNYPYSAPTPPCQSTFTLTVVDPCDSTSITTVPASIENLVAFAGFTVSSKVKYTFNDTSSVIYTHNTDSIDFCGDKKLAFSLNGTSTTYLCGNNSDYIYLSLPADTTNYGSAQATVQASMKNDPLIVSSPISFTATILGSTVPIIQD